MGVPDEEAKRLVGSFRSLAIGRVRPFIPAFKVYPVPLPDSPGRSAVVVEVPRSTEAPHLVVWDQNAWRYPKRVGTDTVWLGESDLEAAYRRRFALRQDAQSHLQRLHDELRPRLYQEPGGVVWLAGGRPWPRDHDDARCTHCGEDAAGPGKSARPQDAADGRHLPGSWS